MIALKPHDHIVILTGAGISKESGLDTLRDADGIWQRYSLEDVCTPEGFARNPVMVHDFYNQRRRQLLEEKVAPNAAHTALADLARRWPGKITLITQNIDDLHERGGSSSVIHMHGELTKMMCTACHAVHHWVDNCAVDAACPKCRFAGAMRPDIVWFGEMPYHIDRIYQALNDADLFVAIGTSGTVYPAAGFASHVWSQDIPTYEINLVPSGKASYFKNGYYGFATLQVPLFVKDVLHGAGLDPMI